MNIFDTWGPNFHIKFEFKLLKPQGLGTLWRNIMHLTTGENCCKIGSVIPGVWLLSNSTGTYFSVYLALTENKESWTGLKLDINKWYKIELHKRTDIFSLIVNGKYLWSVESGNTEFKNVKWFQSDKWYQSAASEGDVSDNVIELKHFNIQNGDTQLRFAGLFNL